MPYDIHLADRIREYLITVPGLQIEEKEMFRGLSFMINGKMCVSVSGDEMMVRFDPALQDVLAEKSDFRVMQMNNNTGKTYYDIVREVIAEHKHITLVEA